MITQRLILRQYNWAITILYECDCSDIPVIFDHLISIDCSPEFIEDVNSNLSKCKKNTGLSYSNYENRRTIIVINKHTSIDELINTTVHESYHFVQQLNKVCDIQDEETLATLQGNFYMNISKIVRVLFIQ